MSTDVFYFGRVEIFTKPKAVGDVVREVLASKKATNKSPKYITSLRQYLMLFIRNRETRPIASFVPSDIDEWFSERMECPTTRASNLGRLSALFGYAVRRGYIKTNPVDNIERITIDRHPPRILSISESVQLMQAVKKIAPDMRPYISLGLFCGVRPEELLYLKWESLDLQRGILTVTRSKVRRRRIVYLPENVKAWIAPCNRDIPMIWSLATIIRRRHAISLECGISWEQDLMRHTAASYMLAQSQNPNYVAMQLGNSPKILMQHYSELVSKGQALEFFSIYP